MAGAPTEPIIKPRYRGRIHQGAFFAAIPAGALLIFTAHRASQYVAAAIFASSILALFGTSAAYHRRQWTETWRARMQRLDHAMIFVLIAGSYTPLTVVALGHALGITLLVLVWAVAALGIVATMVRYDIVDRYEGVLYVAFGWFLVPVLPAVVHALSVTELVCLISGGLFYTIGAIGFVRERPDPRPTIFGYHEVWHVMTVAAASCHFALVFLLVH